MILIGELLHGKEQRMILERKGKAMLPNCSSDADIP